MSLTRYPPRKKTPNRYVHSDGDDLVDSEEDSLLAPFERGDLRYEKKSLGRRPRFRNGIHKRLEMKKPSAASQLLQPIAGSVALNHPTKHEERPQLAGWYSWRPDFLQQVYGRNVNAFLLALLAVSQGITASLTAANMAPIERRYRLSSLESGLIPACSNISSGIFALLLNFMASCSKRKPLWIMTASWIMATGVLLMTVPKYLNGLYHPVVERHCKASDSHLTNDRYCRDDESGMKYIFYAAQVVIGLGIAIIMVVAPTIIDSTVQPKYAPIYLSTFYISQIIGAGIGMLMASPLLKFHVDVDTAIVIELTSDDPRWVGAWWMGYIIVAGFFVILGVIFSLYDDELPEEAALRSVVQGDKEKGTLDEEFVAATEVLTCDNWWDSLQALSRNLPFICLCCAAAVDQFFTSAITVFISKVVQHSFGIPAARAPAIIAPVAPALVIGLALAAYISKRYELEAPGLILMAVAATAGAVLCSALMPLLGCEQPRIYGMNQPYAGNPNQTRSDLKDSCNSQCDCSAVQYSPLCDAELDKPIMFFSPCHAGCGNGTLTDTANCACMRANSKPLLNEPCNSDHCIPKLVGFVLLTVFCMMCKSIAYLPCVAATLRSVEKNQRAFALGIQLTMTKLLGASPGPALMGKIIDTTCLKLHGVFCPNDDTRFCELYDIVKMGNYLTAAMASTQKIQTAVSSTTYFNALANVFRQLWQHKEVIQVSMVFRTRCEKIQKYT